MWIWIREKITDCNFQVLGSLFVAQYHIWLAADAHGILVLIPGQPLLNLLVTSFLFICVCHEVHVLTHRLLPYVVPADWRALLRNSFLLGSGLVGLAASHQLI
ncbi:unnamed protein product [Protopolystoma xenopodis]|uniref:Cas1p 10 TM acyl transferase domain-containing protein n=1 Tax=Protopolystoma xenopodis TaxID=117903 RepID=A0A448WD86_9PLAT|nr:unnamed protein product [Protopolystoma xenopodis]